MTLNRNLLTLNDECTLESLKASVGVEKRPLNVPFLQLARRRSEFVRGGEERCIREGGLRCLRLRLGRVSLRKWVKNDFRRYFLRRFRARE